MSNNIVKMRTWKREHNWEYQPEVKGIGHIPVRSFAEKSAAAKKKAKERANRNTKCTYRIDR